jgi:hypothetical protein
MPQKSKQKAPKKNQKRKALRPTSSSTRARAIAAGYRSGLEECTSRQIKESGLEVLFEIDKVAFEWPPRRTTYTPDFKLPKPGGFFYIETKGRFEATARHKHLLIKEQCPDIDIRFVFSNARAKIYKGSPTTHAMWCDKHGFKWAHKTIPDEWLEESKDGIQSHGDAQIRHRGS